MRRKNLTFSSTTAITGYHANISTLRRSRCACPSAESHAPGVFVCTCLEPDQCLVRFSPLLPLPYAAPKGGSACVHAVVWARTLPQMHRGVTYAGCMSRKSQECLLMKSLPRTMPSLHVKTIKPSLSRTRTSACICSSMYCIGHHDGAVAMYGLPRYGSPVHALPC